MFNQSFLAKAKNPSCPWLDWCGKSFCAMSICFQPSCQSHTYCNCTAAALDGFAVLLNWGVRALLAVIPLRFSQACPHNVRQSVTLHRRHRSNCALQWEGLKQCFTAVMVWSSRMCTTYLQLTALAQWQSRQYFTSFPFNTKPLSQQRASPSNFFEANFYVGWKVGR